MTRRVLAALAALLGVLALFAGSPYRARPAALSVTAVELAEWIRDRKPELRIIDLRTEEQFDDYHLPRAERMAAESLAATPFKPEETIVLVSGDARAAEALGNRKVYVLRGGLHGWIDEVMNPTVAENASPAARAAFQRASVVSRYFGGVPRIVDKLPTPRREDTAAAIAAIRRRGC
ncbi:MAG TPA: rhodanese-like domain-containing protein [Thermoanaerobaculia bacterium]|nr:rhodanese-like domain-containing protein [Thermoanaerobaculia bacterium]